MYPKINVTWHETGDGGLGWAAVSHTEKKQKVPWMGMGMGMSVQMGNGDGDEDGWG